MVAQSCGQATAIREAQRDKTPEFGRPEPLIPSKSALLRSAISSPEGENAAIQAVFPQTLNSKGAKARAIRGGRQVKRSQIENRKTEALSDQAEQMGIKF